MNTWCRFVARKIVYIRGLKRVGYTRAGVGRAPDEFSYGMEDEAHSLSAFLGRCRFADRWPTTDLMELPPSGELLCILPVPDEAPATSQNCRTTRLWCALSDTGVSFEDDDGLQLL